MNSVGGVLQSYSHPIQDSSAFEPDALMFDWKDGLMIVFLIWGSALSTALNAAAWLILVLWSLTGTSRAVRAMILGHVLFSMNPALLVRAGIFRA